MSFNLMVADNTKCPCRECDVRHAFCHGTCEKYKEWERSRPRTPRNLYNARGKMKDPFHKKGRIIKNGRWIC